MTESFLYAAARTPFGRFGGALAETRPDDLAAIALRGVLAKAPELDPAEIGDVVLGQRQRRRRGQPQRRPDGGAARRPARVGPARPRSTGCAAPASTPR